MAWTPPTQHLRQDKKLLKDKVFYRKLSAQWNYLDPDATMLFYLGFIQMIADELKKHKFVRLPHLGDMAVVTQKNRIGWAGKAHTMLGPREVLKFYPKPRMRQFVRNHVKAEI